VFGTEAGGRATGALAVVSFCGGSARADVVAGAIGAAELGAGVVGAAAGDAETGACERTGPGAAGC
jgi:hypothetical protein